MSQNCLYCDRPLALLKRLTGDGEFCSKEHRKIYQQRHNQLALERLLQPPQPKGGAPRGNAPRGNAPNVPAGRPAPEPVQPKEDRQPQAAEFLPDEFKAGSRAEVASAAASPRFENTPPPELGSFPSLSPQQDRAERPKSAAFVPDSPDPQVVEPSAKEEQKAAPKRPARNLRKETGPAPNASGEARQPGGAGFIFRAPSLSDLPAISRLGTKARFSRTVEPSLFHTRSTVDMPGPTLRAARLIANSNSPPVPEGKPRRVETTPRWSPLEPVLPAQEGVKITLVLGSFVQRPIRLAGQDRLPDSFQLHFLPISFPQYAARMGCLEERLHRTDRIGFTPP